MASGVIVVGCQDRHWHGIDASTGKQKWRYATDKFYPSLRSPVIVNETAIVQYGYQVVGLALSTGEKVGSFELSAEEGPADGLAVADLSERRFGKRSAAAMSQSVHEYVQIMDDCRYFGYNNYVFDLTAVHKTDDQCWFKTLRRDWWGYVDGQRNLLRMQRALLAAFGEAGNQAGNRAYDQYIVELYRFLAAEASNSP